ncbi:uncharacterized protein PAF06_009718 [Gastrophryne carolinensis]
MGVSFTTMSFDGSMSDSVICVVQAYITYRDLSTTCLTFQQKPLRMDLRKHLLVLAAVIIGVSCSHFLDQEWGAWKTKYEKTYVTPYEESFRRKTWEDTWHRVQKHNQLYEQGLLKYSKAVNKFADMTQEERSSRSCFSAKGKQVKQNFPVRTDFNNVNLPESVDWRDSNCISRVRDQGGFCGSCWAFSVVGVVEAHNCIRTKELVELSEQQLVDCDGSNEGCCGGMPRNALNYVAEYGIMKATDYEYSQKKFTCLYKPESALKFNVTKSYILPGEGNMASAVALEGPVTVGLDASSDLMEYNGGIFTGSCTNQANHAVIIIGYGTEKKDGTDEATDYWIVRNRMHISKVASIWLALVICTCAAQFLDDEWSAWKLKHGKMYTSTEEEILRRKAWEDNWHMIQNHNELADKGLTTYRMAMNHFGDMTREKLKSRSCLLTTGYPSNVPTQTYGLLTNVPDHVDWRDSDCMTPAKNQGSFCGSCWAFATVGVLESRLCIKGQELLNLSEQHLVDCDTEDYGCCGGLPVLALIYVEEYGIMKTEEYQYAGKKLSCSYDSDKAIILNTTKVYLLRDEHNMASSVAHEGPITVGFGVDLEFQFYSEGVYDGDCASQANHAIIIVGYGTEKDEEKGDQDYWIIKNSWSEEWGEKGFGKIKRNVNKCFIANMAATIDFM